MIFWTENFSSLLILRMKTKFILKTLKILNKLSILTKKRQKNRKENKENGFKTNFWKNYFLTQNI